VNYRPFTSSVRIGDAEREAAVSALNRHYAEGRLTSVEHDERITWALAAQTSGDLDKLFADLPTVGGPSFAGPFAAGSFAGGAFPGMGRQATAARHAFRGLPLPLLLLGFVFAVFVLVHLLPIIAVIALVLVVRGTLMRRHFARSRRRAGSGYERGYESYGRGRW